jgi:hypothetical protein
VPTRWLDPALFPFFSEVKNRLLQMNWILSRATTLDRQMSDIAASDNWLMGDPVLFELEIMTEAFYHCAWRAFLVIKELPGFKSFDCKGVIRVRNNLIQHPEHLREGAKTIPIFSWLSGDGPKIKDYIMPDEVETYHDLGLFVNAQEFETNLIKCLQKCIENPADIQ